MWYDAVYCENKLLCVVLLCVVMGEKEETSGKEDGALTGFLKCIDAILHRTVCVNERKILVVTFKGIKVARTS